MLHRMLAGGRLWFESRIRMYEYWQEQPGQYKEAGYCHMVNTQQLNAKQHSPCHSDPHQYIEAKRPS